MKSRFSIGVMLLAVLFMASEGFARSRTGQDLGTRIAALEAAVLALDARVTANEADIAMNAGDILNGSGSHTVAFRDSVSNALADTTFSFVIVGDARP